VSQDLEDLGELGLVAGDELREVSAG